MSEPIPDLESLFLSALEIESSEEQAAFLQRSCGENASLRQEVQRLLASHRAAGSFLEKPAQELEGTISHDLGGQNLAASLRAGFAPAFREGEAIVVASAGHSVLESLGQSMNLASVVLRDAKDAGREPIVQPKSPEMPERKADSRYRLDGEIARGGMGAILKGRNTDLGRDLAIKVLLDAHKDKPEVIQRFIEEAQIGGQLQHPGIAPIYELGQFADRRPFFAMKLVKGETLSKLLADRNETAQERGKFIGIFEQICQTMAYAHCRGVIHRDLKPANIMVGAFGEVQVMDWGLAKVLSTGGVADEKKSQQMRPDQTLVQTLRSNAGSDAPGSFGSNGSQTQMGSVMGTPGYMPPEQALGEIDHLDERTDVFGLGAILCEILTGKPPYVGENGAQVYRLASRGKLDDCFQRLDACGADDDLIALTKHCLALEPSDRPRDAGVLAARISGYVESVNIKLRQTEMAIADAEVRAEELRRRHKLALAAGAAIVASLVLGIGASAWQANRAAHEAERARSAEHRAVAAFDELRASAPAFAEQARALASREHFDEAVEKLDYAVKLRPDAAEYLVAKADLLQCQLKLAAAATIYRDALRLRSGLARAETSAKLCVELLAAKPKADGKLTRESLAKLHLAMQRQQRPAAELMPVARLLGEEKKLLVEYWLARLQDLPVSAERPLKERLTVRDDGRLALDLSDTKVLDLSPLADAPIAALDLSNCSELADVSSLPGLLLIELNISATSVADLTPLGDMHTLEALEMSGSKVTDLSPLAALRLRSLNFRDCAVSDLSPIGKMPLEELNLRKTRVSDLSPLVDMPIKSIDVGETPLLDYSPLAKLPLEKCYFNGNRIADLSVLRGKPLKELVLARCEESRNFAAIADMDTLELLLLPRGYRTLPDADYAAIGSLRRLPKLRQLGIEYAVRLGSTTAGVGRHGEAAQGSYAATPAAEIFWNSWDVEQKFLPALRKSGFNFWVYRRPDGTYGLEMYHQAISDLNIIKGAPISEILLIGGEVTDLTPLAGMPLTLLNIPGNPVSDLTPLRGMPLERIFLMGTKVRDLSPLVGLPLKALFLGSCKELNDVAPLAEIPTLEHLIIPPHAAHIDLLRKLPRLQRLGYTLTGLQPMLPETTAEEFWKSHTSNDWIAPLRDAGINLTGVKRLNDGTWEASFSGSTFQDLQLLHDAPISILQLGNTAVADLTPLSGMPLRALTLDNTQVTDLSPLKGMPLKTLSLRGTRVTDLSPLRGMNLASLLLINCRKLTNLSPLAECQELTTLTLPPNAKNIEFLRTLPKIERLSFQETPKKTERPDKTVAEFWKEYDAKQK